MSENPPFTFNVHGTPVQATASRETTGLILEFDRRHGPAVIIYTDSRELSASLAAAITAVLDAHRASTERPVMAEAAE